MQKYNYSKLLGRMKEYGFTQESLAEKMGLGVCSLNFSLNNKRNFRQDEILKIGEILGLAADDLPDYFFVHKL